MNTEKNRSLKCAVVLITLSFMAGCATTSEKPKVTIHYNELGAEWPDWYRISHAAETPEMICYYVRNYMTYTKDTSEKLSFMDSKLAFWAGKGDCEEFAMIVNDMCKEKGFYSRVWILSAKKGDEQLCHAVAIGYYDDQMWMSNNGRYIEIDSVKQGAKRWAGSVGADVETTKYYPLDKWMRFRR